MNDSFSPLDYFIMMFPINHLNTIVLLTNEQLSKSTFPDYTKKNITVSEFLKFFGLIILITCFEFGDRSSLWSTVGRTKYIDAHSLGSRTGMGRDRFDDIFSCIRFSHHPDARPEGMSTQTYRWMLIKDFVVQFNEHRQTQFTPSDLLIVDESMSRWYGQGGMWINIALPNYVALDRKPDSGCEIHTASCGHSGIMIRLRLVKHQQENDEELNETSNESLLHGKKLLKELVLPWANTNRIVCADSYFASVVASDELKKIGLHLLV